MINWLGLQTLYIREVNRFLKVYNQTLVAPMVNAMLFFAVFSLAIGNRVNFVSDIPFQTFIVPGLIMMTVLQNAFANTSSSFIMGKVLGTFIDYLMPPISAGEMTLGMVAGGITRGFAAGLMVFLAVSFFVTTEIHDIFAMFAFVILASMMMALVGMLAGIFADTFDQMAAITSYIVTPLAFLSGTFYSTKQLPEFWQTLNHFNPFFYAIDGFRYGMIGHGDVHYGHGLLVISLTNLVLITIVYRLISIGYRIKN